MSRFIGLDVHTQSCTAVVLGASGRKLREQVLETDPKVLGAFVRSVRRERLLCMEEGQQTAWLYEVLEPLTDELVVVQPPRHHGHKSDARDAWVLAEHLRVGSKDIKRVYKPNGLHTELREAWTTYRVVKKDLVRVKSRIHASATSRGLKQASDLYDPLDRHDVLAQLPTHMARRTKAWCDELDGLVDRFEESEQWLLDVAARTPIVGRIATAPGIGIKRAAALVAIMVTPWRFRTKRQLWSYSGLGVVTRVSSEWVPGPRGGWVRDRAPQTRGLNRNRHPEMKNTFKGAAEKAIQMKGHPLQEHYERLTSNGTKPNLAKLTIARRIAAAVLAMWKNNEDYDPDKHRR